MSINSVSAVSFKASIPVKYFAKNPKNDKYVPVLKNENIRKCHGFVVRNLNRTAKNNVDKDFVNFYKNFDRDYRNVPFVHSVYKQIGPVVYLITGSDVDTVKNLAKPVGIAKSEAINVLGDSRSFDSVLAARTYESKVQNCIDNYFRPVKSKDNNNPLELQVYFNPEFRKKSGELKGFNFVGAQFVDTKTQEIKEVYRKE